MESIPTDEQKKARGEAMKTARDAGKKGKEVWDAADTAMKLTDEQKAKLAEARKQWGDVLWKERREFCAILTPEQLKKLPPTPWDKPGEKPAEKPAPGKTEKMPGGLPNRPAWPEFLPELEPDARAGDETGRYWEAERAEVQGRVGEDGQHPDR